MQGRTLKNSRHNVSSFDTVYAAFSDREQKITVSRCFEKRLRCPFRWYADNAPIHTNIRDSNAGYYDLHLALHSNAAPESMAGKLQGTDVYYYANSPFGRNAAEIIADNFKEIYPNPDLVKAVPTTSLAEVTKTNAPAVLIETAYHDNPQDAEWIRTHIQEMAANLVKSLTDIFGIPFISTPVPERTGTVTTQSTPLNIRSRPNLNAPIIGQIPKGASVKVLGQWENWYVVDYQGTVGYSSSDYITV